MSDTTQAVTQQKSGAKDTGASKNNEKVNDAKSTPAQKANKDKPDTPAKMQEKQNQKPSWKDRSLICSHEIFSWVEAHDLAQRDGKELSDKEKLYAGLNCFQYYIALNTWGAVLIPEPNFGNEDLFRTWVKHYGVRACIQAADDLADAFIDHIDGNGYQGQLFDLSNLDNSALFYLIGERDPGEVLSALRFPKRFTPDGASKLERASEEKFISILHETNWRYASQLKSRDPDVSVPKLGMWGAMVKKYLDIILKDFKKYYETSTCSFSSGNCTDGNTLVEKLAAYSECSPYFDIEGLGLPNGVRRAGNPKKHGPICARGCYLPVKTKKGLARGKFIPVIRPVPKTLKSHRMIGPESAYVSAQMQRVREALVQCLANSKYAELFQIKTQEPNRVLCFEASKDKVYITVDLSSASDREAKHVMRQLINDEVWEVIDEFLPVAIQVGGKQYAPSIFLTSGNPATFVFLGILVLSIALAAKELHRHYFPFERTGMPQIFGDDALVDARYSEEFFSILEHLGLKVNYRKTFLNHYRESCGVEYVDGYPTTTDYWPRRTISDPRVSGNVEDLQSLIMMEHRLYWNTRIRAFLIEVVRQVNPKVTTSEAGSDVMDLWAFVYDRKALAPHDPNRKCENHSYTGLSKETIERGWAARGRHSAITSEKSPDWEKLPDEAVEAVEVYLYYRFLATGPYYPDELSRLLKVSEPITKELSAVKPILRLATVIR